MTVSASLVDEDADPFVSALSVCVELLAAQPELGSAAAERLTP